MGDDYLHDIVKKRAEAFGVKDKRMNVLDWNSAVEGGTNAVTQAVNFQSMIGNFGIPLKFNGVPVVRFGADLGDISRTVKPLRCELRRFRSTGQGGRGCMRGGV